MNTVWLSEEIELQLKAETNLQDVIVTSEQSAIVIDWNFAKNNRFDIYDGQSVVAKVIKRFDTTVDWNLADGKSLIKFTSRY